MHDKSLARFSLLLPDLLPRNFEIQSDILVFHLLRASRRFLVIVRGQLTKTLDRNRAHSRPGTPTIFATRPATSHRLFADRSSNDRKCFLTRNADATERPHPFHRYGRSRTGAVKPSESMWNCYDSAQNSWNSVASRRSIITL